MACYVIIPCRYGSERFPGKPLTSILGTPMIKWVYKGVEGSLLVDDIFVATDDDRIAGVCKQFGAKVIMTREEHASGTDRIGEAASKLGCKDDDIIINIQGDEPLVNREIVDVLARSLVECRGIPMSTLAFPSTSTCDYYNPNVVKVVFDRNGYALYFSRSPIPCYRDRMGDFLFWKHQGFYAYRYGFLKEFISWKPSELERREKLEQLRALEYGATILVVPSPKDTIGVDTPEDIERVRPYLTNFSEHCEKAPVW